MKLLNAFLLTTFITTLKASSATASSDCVTITKNSDLEALSGQTATLCSFDIFKETCDASVKIEQTTSWTCEQGGTCRINCGWRSGSLQFFAPLDNQIQVCLTGNFVFDGTGLMMGSGIVASGNVLLNLVGVTYKNFGRGTNLLVKGKANANIYNSTFSSRYTGILVQTNSKVSVVRSTFRNLPGIHGYAIRCQSHDNFISIKTSVFENAGIMMSTSSKNGIKTDVCEAGGTKFINDSCDMWEPSPGNRPRCIAEDIAAQLEETEFCDFRQAGIEAEFDDWNPSEMTCPAPTTASPTSMPTDAPTKAPTDAPTDKAATTLTPKVGKEASSSGDPHFKTWHGDKYDYHGECDLVLVDNPSFANGLGLRIHIRTTRVKYFSFIEKVALQIGDEILEFDNDVNSFLINGAKVEKNRKHHKTMLGAFEVRRDKKSISLRLHKEGKAKIDLHTRKNGFPAVIVDGGETDIFEDSLGLLGEWSTGRTLARDGKTEIPVQQYEATEFALEWQVRDDEPMLFKEARFPQFPTICTPPAEMSARLGSSQMKLEAEEACAHWKKDKQDCVFDVIATRDVLVAQEGHIVHVM